MSFDNHNVLKSSSVQWRLINPNRPVGMPPLVPTISNRQNDEIVNKPLNKWRTQRNSWHLMNSNPSVGSVTNSENNGKCSADSGLENKKI